MNVKGVRTNKMTLPIKLIETIGHGSQGRVYRGYHLGLEKEVAVKKVKSPYIAKKEIKMLEYATLHSCPGIVPYIEHHVHNEDYWIVMDYLPGVTGRCIQDLNKQGTFMSESEVSEIMLQLCQTLQFLHHHEIIYGDVKLANFIYQPPKKATLIDFGCARKGPYIHHRIGTPTYFAPEKFYGSSSFAGDVWAMGTLFYLLLSGQYPYYAQGVKYKEITDMYIALMDTPLQFDAPRWNAISQDTKDLIEGMLDKSYKHRYTIDEVVCRMSMQKLFPREYRKVDVPV